MAHSTFDHNEVPEMRSTNQLRNTFRYVLRGKRVPEQRALRLERAAAGLCIGFAAPQIVGGGGGMSVSYTCVLLLTCIELIIEVRHRECVCVYIYIYIHACIHMT